MMQSATTAPQIRAVDSSLMLKMFYAFVALALLSAAISVGGKRLGRTIALAGHTESTALREIVIGNDVISAPDNTIRFERARHDGAAARLDLYMRWPGLEGYSDARRADFNHSGEDRRIIFLSIEEQTMSRDMSGRLDPIYAPMLEQPGVPGFSGVTFYEFSKKSGYLNEVLAVSDGAAGEPLVARCLSGPGAADSLAPCERDIHVGDGLSLSYRFPQELLADWRQLDAAIREKVTEMIETGE